MSAHVVVTLDTTAPALDVEATQDPGQPTLLSLALTTDDAIEYRLWGGIDPTDPINASYAETLGAATWQEFDPTLAVRVVLDGPAVYVQVRDDVWNESEAILISGVPAPPVEPPVVTPPAPGWPVDRQPARRPRRTVSSTSRVRFGVRTDVTRTAPVERRREISTRSSVHVRVHSGRIVGRHLGRSRVRFDTRTAVRGSHHGTSAIAARTSTDIHRRREGPGTEAALIELDLL